MICAACGHICRLGDAIPCAGGGTGYGCPSPDCGGTMAPYPGRLATPNINPLA